MGLDTRPWAPCGKKTQPQKIAVIQPILNAAADEITRRVKAESGCSGYRPYHSLRLVAHRGAHGGYSGLAREQPADRNCRDPGSPCEGPLGYRRQ